MDLAPPPSATTFGPARKPAHNNEDNMDHKDLCEHTRIRLIAAAVGYQQCTKTAGTEVQIPGTDKRILIGNDAYLAKMAAPAASVDRLASTAVEQAEPAHDEAARLRKVLIDVRHALQFASDSPGGGINDTIWMMHTPETLFDFIDAALGDTQAAPASPEQVQAIPSGWKLVAVNPEFDSLMYWMDRAHGNSNLPCDVGASWEMFEFVEKDRLAAPSAAAPAAPEDVDELVSMAQVENIRDGIKPGDGWGGDEWDYALANAVAARFSRPASHTSEQVAIPDSWISVDTDLPKGECLAIYITPNGKQRMIRAKYAHQFQIEAEGDDCETEYNDDDDTFYIKAGWLECVDNWGEYSSCYVTEGTVTHWMPLPAAPGAAAPAAPIAAAQVQEEVRNQAQVDAIMQAINHACGSLPEGYEVILEMENGAGGVVWIDDEGERHVIDGEGYISQDINEAVERAIEHASTKTAASTEGEQKGGAA